MQVAYLCVPDFAATVARRADHRLGDRPLALLDDQGRVLVADTQAAVGGMVPGMSERTAALRCPRAILVSAARYPLLEAQETFSTQIKHYADRWQPDGPGRVYLDTAHVSRDLVGWCQAVAGGVRALGWVPALGATGSKFGAAVAGQAAGVNTALLMIPPALGSFLAEQPVATLPLDIEALLQLRHLGIRTLGQFARLPATGVVVRFGPQGHTAQRWAQGLDDRPVVAPWEAPEVSAHAEFDTPLADRMLLLGVLGRHAEHLLAPLRERFQAPGRIVLRVTRADGRLVQSSHVFPMPTSAAGPVGLGLAAALDHVVWDNQPAADIALTLAGITDLPSRQLTLFDLVPDARARLRTTLDALSARFGPDAFRLAALTDPDNPLPERRVSWRKFA